VAPDIRPGSVFLAGPTQDVLHVPTLRFESAVAEFVDIQRRGDRSARQDAQ
jgi:hypothetical protein